MHTGLGAAIVVSGSALFLLTALVVRPRVRQAASDVLTAASGAGVAVGGLLLLSRDVSPASWVVAPVVLGLLAVAHNRMLFRGAGPFRT